MLSSQISVSCKRESIIKAVISSILSIMYSRMPTAQRGINKYLSKLHFSLTSSTLHSAPTWSFLILGSFYSYSFLPDAGFSFFVLQLHFFVLKSLVVIINP